MNQQIQLEANFFSSESRKEGEISEEKGEEDTKELVEVLKLVQQPITLRRSTRERKTPKRYEDFASSIALITEDGNLLLIRKQWMMQITKSGKGLWMKRSIP